MKRSIVFSQTLRVTRICSRGNDYQDHFLQIRSWFLKRKYSEKLNDNEMKKFSFFSANLHRKKRGKRVPFLTTYQPFLTTYHPMINGSNKATLDNMYLLNINEELGKWKKWKQWSLLFLKLQIVYSRLILYYSCLPIISFGLLLLLLFSRIKIFSDLLIFYFSLYFLNMLLLF